VLKASLVCGSANNQLAEWRHGDELHARGVVYAPDYIANAGGTVFDTDRLWGGVNKDRGMAKVAKIYERMHEVFAISKAEGIPTYAAADHLAETRINGYKAIKRVHGFDQGQRVTI
jgi:leucine dehydrogenase